MNVLGPTYNAPYGTTIITHKKAITLYDKKQLYT